MLTEVLVERVTFAGRRATGIAYRRDGKTETATARREVILAAGAIGSPHLLLLSGVGPAAHLQASTASMSCWTAPASGRICTIICNCGSSIGLMASTRSISNTIRCGAARWIGIDYALRRRGPLTMTASTLGAAAKSDPSQEWPNLCFIILPFSYTMGAAMNRAFDPYPAMTVCVYDGRPTSRGALWLKSGDPAAPPAHRYNYLDHRSRPPRRRRRRAGDAAHARAAGVRALPAGGNVAW